MKTVLTAETRPRMWSGVSTCTSVWRTTTEMLSTSPVMKSAKSDSQRLRERPKTTTAAPKPATAQSMARPAWRMGGRCVRYMAIASEPTAGAARNQPNSRAPTCRMSCAKTGSRYVAPPSSTATRSSVIVAKMTFCR